MNYNKDRKILADVDGVFLNWEEAFERWMSARGYEIAAPAQYKMSVKYGIAQHTADHLVGIFNNSAWIGYLNPLRDAVDWVHKLVSEGWHFECITSLSDDPYAVRLREMNLEHWFGRGAMRRVQCIATGADKDEYLKAYEHSHWWIEDKPENAMAGLYAGHKPILIQHDYNLDFFEADVTVVENWQQIYNLITNSEE